MFLARALCASSFQHIIFFFTGSTAPVGPGPFFSFIIIFTDGRTPWASDQLVARPLPKYRTTQTQNKHIRPPNIHALCGIRIHDPSFRANEDSSCLRLLGYCDRRFNISFFFSLALQPPWALAPFSVS
jgi:hypothetical protein